MRKMLHTKALVTRDSVGASQAGVIDQIIGSTPVVDRMGDIIAQDGWDLKDFKNNPVILWGHNMDGDRPPIAKSLKTWVEGKGNDAKLMFKVQFDLADEFAADIYRKIKEGFINTVSVGFMPTEYEELEPGNFWGGLKYTAQQLLELSFVPVPANPEALVGLRSYAKTDKRFTPITEEKLFAPIKSKEEIQEMLNVKVDENGKVKGVDEEGTVTHDEPGTDNNGNNSDVEDMPGYDHTANMGDITVKDMRYEMNTCMEACIPGATKAQETGTETDEDTTPKDEFQNSQGMGDMAEVPGDNMMVKDMSVGHARALFTDIFGDWQSNLNTTSNEGSNSEDVNNYSFEEGEEKAETLRKAKGLVTIIEKAGRVLSKKNEDKIKQAIDQLNQVIAELEQDEQEEGAEGKSLKDEITEAKGVIGYADHGKSPESEAWDGPGEKAKATAEDLEIMCAWHDSENSDAKASFKLLHHKADEGHPSVWRGVTAAMASLMGSRGGTDIPEAGRKGVYDHLAKHYAEYDKVAPDFKMVEDQVLKNLGEEILALVLEREEKHVVRLVKKVLENQKEEKKEKIVTPNVELRALELIDLALTKVSSIKMGGGDK